jgi:hypothetical protein
MGSFRELQTGEQGALGLTNPGRAWYAVAVGLVPTA